MEDKELKLILNSIRDEISNLSNRLEQDDVSDKTEASRSSTLKNLFSALALAQSEMPAVAGNKTNPYFQEKYIDLGQMITAARPSLTKNGLAVIQQILPNADGQMILHTLLTHESGEWIESRLRVIPPKNDIRTMDSYITYLRRVAYASIVGIVGAEDDDDGEYASATSRETFAKGTALNTKYNPKENKLETVTKEQLEELEYELADYTDIAEMVLDGLKIQNLADMPKEKFMQSVTKIRKIKMLREGKSDKA